MDKDFGDMVTSTSISIKVKNMVKLKEFAKTKQKSVSSVIDDWAGSLE
jgi:hypothetical protein